MGLGPSGAPGVNVAQPVVALGSGKELETVTLLDMVELTVLLDVIMRSSTALHPTVMVRGAVKKTN